MTRSLVSLDGGVLPPSCIMSDKFMGLARKLISMPSGQAMAALGGDRPSLVYLYHLVFFLSYMTVGLILPFSIFSTFLSRSPETGQQGIGGGQMHLNRCGASGPDRTRSAQGDHGSGVYSACHGWGLGQKPDSPRPASAGDLMQMSVEERIIVATVAMKGATGELTEERITTEVTTLVLERAVVHHTIAVEAAREMEQCLQALEKQTRSLKAREARLEERDRTLEAREVTLVEHKEGACGEVRETTRAIVVCFEGMSPYFDLGVDSDDVDDKSGAMMDGDDDDDTANALGTLGVVGNDGWS
uniref:Uncharacterized protein n=1 Tax=Oryza brachyantha TaxID=4533 RepID=J3MK00_ORYBR